MNKDTAWHMAMRIRKAMIERSDLLQGVIELDATYVGGKPRKENKEAPENPMPKKKRGRGTKKAPVVRMIERGHSVKAKAASDLKAKTLSGFV